MNNIISQNKIENKNITNISSNFIYNDSALNNSGIKFRRNLGQKRMQYRNYKKYVIDSVPIEFISYSKSKTKKNNSKKRNLDEKNDINNITSNNFTGNITIEEYYTIPSSPSVNIDLRESNNGQNNSSNLTQLSISEAESDDAKMEGSLINSTINSKINKEGILESIQEIIYSSMVSKDLENDENDEDTNNLYNEIYGKDKNNQISFKEAKEMDKIQNENNQNKMKIPLININTTTVHTINIFDYFIDEKINNKLYNYFDNFTYEIYNRNDNESDEIDSNMTNEENKENGLRRLEEEISYYGKKKLVYCKQLYKYNILGIRMEKQSIIETNPATGITSAYFIKIFGNKNEKITISDHYTNDHIITDRTNQLGYNLILLLYQTILKLEDKNNLYTNKIKEIEMNISQTMNDYDYSNVFRDSLDDLYKKVQNFSSVFFIELISLINKAYDDYNMILKDAIDGKYIITNKIRNRMHL